MILHLPLPPSLNNAFPTVRIRGKNRRVPSAEYKAWKMGAGLIALQQWRARGSPLFARHYASHWRFNIDHGGDIGNREKCGTDLLVATIPGFPGDQWCDRILIERDRTIEGAVVEVTQLR